MVNLLANRGWGWLRHGAAIGSRVWFCVVVPVAVVPTEWYLLDLGRHEPGYLLRLAWVLALYLSSVIGFFGAPCVLAWTALRGVFARRFPPSRTLVWCALAMCPMLLLCGCKWFGLDNYGYLARHSEQLMKVVESRVSSDDSDVVLWRDEDLVVIDVDFVFLFRHRTCFAYCASAADKTTWIDWMSGVGADESAKALDRMRARWTDFRHRHVCGPWSQVTIY